MSLSPSISFFKFFHRSAIMCANIASECDYSMCVYVMSLRVQIALHLLPYQTANPGQHVTTCDERSLGRAEGKCRCFASSLEPSV